MHYNTTRYYKRKAEMIEYLGGRCIDCGCSKKLEIHHKNPEEKEFNVSTNFSRPWNELLIELNKCQLLCSNCHKKKHQAEHGLGMYSHHKCRCEVCRKIMSIANKKYKEKARRKKDNATVTQSGE